MSSNKFIHEVKNNWFDYVLMIFFILFLPFLFELGQGIGSSFYYLVLK